MKKLLTAALAALILLTTACCALAEPTSVYALKGPTGIGLTGVMMNNDGAYDFTLVGAADEIVAAIASGESKQNTATHSAARPYIFLTISIAKNISLLPMALIACKLAVCTGQKAYVKQ